MRAPQTMPQPRLGDDLKIILMLAMIYVAPAAAVVLFLWTALFA